MCHGIAELGGWCQGKVNDAEGNAKALGGHVAHELTCTRDLKRGLLDLLGNLIQGGTLEVAQRTVNHAGAGNAHGNHAIRFLDAVEGTRHEWVVAHGVCKDHKLGTGDRRLILGQFGSLFDDLAHALGGIHVDARARGRDIYGGAHELRSGQGLRDRIDELLFRGGSTLFHESRITTDEVHAGLSRGAIECLGHLNGVSFDACDDERYRRDGDALINDRNAELRLDALAHLNQVLCAFSHQVIYRLGSRIHG